MEPHFAFPLLDNIDVLRAMGVSFVITDTNILSKEASKQYTIPLKKGATLSLYKLDNPNIGTFSPTKLALFTTTKEFVEHVRRNPKIFDTEAYVSSLTDDRLVPAQKVQMSFEKGGFHLTGTSEGVSAILLPVQFSHCYQIVGSASDGVSIMRANIIHTLLRFEGQLDVHVHWQFNFWGHSECRLKDITDLKALGL
jgi:hypothetical protein